MRTRPEQGARLRLMLPELGLCMGPVARCCPELPDSGDVWLPVWLPKEWPCSGAAGVDAGWCQRAKVELLVGPGAVGATI
jgi:hypothetical protein